MPLLAATGNVTYIRGGGEDLPPLRRGDVLRPCIASPWKACIFHGQSDTLVEVLQQLIPIPINTHHHLREFVLTPVILAPGACGWVALI